MLIHMTIDCAC